MSPVFILTLESLRVFSETLVPGGSHFDPPANSKIKDAKTKKLCTVTVRHISTKTRPLNFQNFNCSIVVAIVHFCA